MITERDKIVGKGNMDIGEHCQDCVHYKKNYPVQPSINFFANVCGKTGEIEPNGINLGQWCKCKKKEVQ